MVSTEHTSGVQYILREGINYTVFDTVQAINVQSIYNVSINCTDILKGMIVRFLSEKGRETGQ